MQCSVSIHCSRGNKKKLLTFTQSDEETLFSFVSDLLSEPWEGKITSLRGWWGEECLQLGETLVLRSLLLVMLMITQHHVWQILLNNTKIKGKYLSVYSCKILFLFPFKESYSVASLKNEHCSKNIFSVLLCLYFCDKSKTTNASAGVMYCFFLPKPSSKSVIQPLNQQSIFSLIAFLSLCHITSFTSLIFSHTI